jgi:hypothetical protein
VNQETGALDRQGFARVIGSTIELLYQGALHARKVAMKQNSHGEEEEEEEDEQTQQCHLLLPMLGFGAYMSRIGAQDSAWAVRYFVRVLSGRAHELRAIMRVTLCDFDSQTRGLDAALYPVQVGRGPEEGNLFAAARRAMASRDVVCVVNAADARSFLGNGGVRDETIDGMLVAGARGERLWGNSAFTHNVFFQPTLLDAHRWQLIKPISLADES